jgi:hypothetical protein
MVIIQEILFRQARGKLPFTVLFYLLGIQMTPGITYRSPLQVMKPEPNAFIEESRTLIETGIKASGGLWCDSLLL